MTGYLALVLVAMIYGAYGIFIRLIGKDFSVFSQSWLRSLIVVIVAASILIFSKTKIISFRKKDLPWIALWLVSGVGTIPLTFTAFNHLPIGTTYLLIYVTMIASGYLSGLLFFKEEITKLKVLSVILAIVGLGVIYSVDFIPQKLPFFVIALGSGALTGVWNTVTKKFSNNYPVFQLVLIDAVAAFFVSIIAFFITREQLPIFSINPAWGWVFVYAIAQVCTVGLIVYGFKKVEAQIGSIILPLETVFGTSLGFFIFGEVLSKGTLTGGSLIIIAAIIPFFAVYLKKLT